MNRAMKFNVKSASVVLVFVLAIGLAFYGGRAYQNNIDQPLFTQYNPPVAAGGPGGAGGAASGRTGSYFGAVSSGGSQVQAALAYATPPGSTTSPISGTASGATGGQPGSGSQGTSGGQGASGAQGGGQSGSGAGGTATSGSAASSTEVTGTLVSLADGKVTVKTTQGANQTVPTSAKTTYYVAKAVAGSAIVKGQKVTIGMAAGGSSSGFSAGDITIAPAGSLYGYVRQLQAASAGGFGFSPAGTVVSLTGSTLTLQTSTGRSMSISVDSSTAVYQLQKATSSDIHTGATVSVLEDPSNTTATALNVVACSVDGMVASLTTPPARGAGGFGGGQGGAPGGTGGGAGAPGGGNGS